MHEVCVGTPKIAQQQTAQQTAPRYQHREIQSTHLLNAVGGFGELFDGLQVPSPRIEEVSHFIPATIYEPANGSAQLSSAQFRFSNAAQRQQKHFLRSWWRAVLYGRTNGEGTYQSPLASRIVNDDAHTPNPLALRTMHPLLDAEKPERDAHARPTTPIHTSSQSRNPEGNRNCLLYTSPSPRDRG